MTRQPAASPDVSVNFRQPHPKGSRNAVRTSARGGMRVGGVGKAREGGNLGDYISDSAAPPAASRRPTAVTAAAAAPDTGGAGVGDAVGGEHTTRSEREPYAAAFVAQLPLVKGLTVHPVVQSADAQYSTVPPSPSVVHEAL